ncbi:MAG: tRNA uridine-5-carboxymethylaminomethyl(34) synthesis GTPase MnmE [Firmicutes bacterium HGW-Firmicutes-1]|jgi:tRNA modification GTPase|nr:MAG: tRNA uridine-5-carboxymethylaminomethyl(34) synthesis GTPase MnmE [Firmicutes bacterium HGW-Firmicutes-1]
MIYDTIAAVATPISSAGIGIIRISGEEAINIVDNIFLSKKKGKCLKHALSHTLNYGYIIDKKNNQVVDEVLVSVMKAPNSFTKENVVEINAHGGIVVVQKILRMVLNEGTRLAEPGEFTKRAFLNGRIDLSQAEAVIDIINAKTEMSLDASVNQLKGSVSAKLEVIKKLVLELVAHIEASIDYPEYDLEELNFDNIQVQIQNIKSLIEELLITYDDGKLIKEGIKTVIIGKPNVGKSSLLNTLLKEQRAIVTDVPGTTRDVLEEYMQIHGIPLRLIDTAGIRETKDIVEKLGVEKSLEKIDEADLILLMLDASEKLDEEDFNILELVKKKKTIVILNKSDLDQKLDIKEIEAFVGGKEIIYMSVKTLDGMNQLEDHIKELFMVGNINMNENVYITSVRHKNALEKAIHSIEQVMNALESKMPVDLLAIDITNIYESIGEITGDSVKEDLIHQIFSQFCIGK